jgi:hypothetical protein
METKCCSKCNQTLTIDCFQLRNDTKKYRNQFNSCRKAINPNKKERKSLEQRKKENTADFKICIKCCQNKSLDQYQQRTDSKSKLYRNDCIDCRNKYVSEFKRTSQQTKDKQNERARERRKNDPCFLINQRLRARLRKVLTSLNVTKNNKMIDILGCSIQDFKQHIEKQFKPGMSWDQRNFVIDHIIPCSYFDLTNVEHQKTCFHYTNMQPLSFTENARKSNKILPEHENLLKEYDTKLSLKNDDGRKKIRVRLKSPDNTMDNPQPSLEAF